MIFRQLFIICENEHGTGNVCFPKVEELELYDLGDPFEHTAASLRKVAKAEGWGRVNGADYCPHCMESM